ncbi:hypothetical protein QX201_010216 [Fusarium graminearum]
MSDFMLDENPYPNGIVDELQPSNPPVQPLPTFQIDPDYNLSGFGNQVQTSIFPPDIEAPINPFPLAAQGYPLAPAAQTNPIALESQTNPPAPLLNALHFATLLHMPMHILELIAKQPVNDPIRDLGTLYTAIQQIHEWSTQSSLPLGFKYPHISSPEESPERQKCVEYDNQRCIVTGHKIKTSCHVIPLSRRSLPGGAGHRLENILSIMEYLVGFSHLSRDVESQELLGMLAAEVDIPKMYWNLITLTPGIANMWERGMFAFRWLHHTRIVADPWSHIGKVRITLEFVWMPFNTSRWRLAPFDLNAAHGL